MRRGQCTLGRPDFGQKVFATIFWNDWVKSEIGTQGNHSIHSLSVPAGAPNIWNIGILPLKPEFQPSCRNRKCMNWAFSFWLSNFIPERCPKNSGKVRGKKIGLPYSILSCTIDAFIMKGSMPVLYSKCLFIFYGPQDPAK